jgi:hypothetical protein
LDEFVLRDEPVAVFDQVSEDVEYPRARVQDLAAPPQLVEPGIEFELAKALNRHPKPPRYREHPRAYPLIGLSVPASEYHAARE